MLQAMTISNIIQQITSTAHIAPTPEISGLSLPAQINIDVSSGCDQTIDAQIVKYEVDGYNAEPYVNEVRGPKIAHSW